MKPEPFKAAALTALALIGAMSADAVARRSDFESRTLFTRSWTTAEGLGPTFNARSCAACHHEGEEASFVHVAQGVTDPTGGHVFGRFRVSASGAIERQAIPAGASLRRPPALAGVGLLERVASADIASGADPNDADGGSSWMRRGG